MDDIAVRLVHTDRLFANSAFHWEKIDFFQVSFVNIVFLIMHTLAVVSNIGIANRIQLLNLKLKAAGSDMALQSAISAVDGGTGTGWPAYVLGGLITVGSLVFMWSVRHPKTEPVE